MWLLCKLAQAIGVSAPRALASGSVVAESPAPALEGAWLGFGMRAACMIGQDVGWILVAVSDPAELWQGWVSVRARPGKGRPCPGVVSLT